MQRQKRKYLKKGETSLSLLSAVQRRNDKDRKTNTNTKTHKTQRQRTNTNTNTKTEGKLFEGKVFGGGGRKQQGREWGIERSIEGRSNTRGIERFIETEKRCPNKL
jgi:hypothetical protein